MLSILRTATLMEIFQSSLPRFVLSSITSLVLFDDEHDHFVLFQRLISYSTIYFFSQMQEELWPLQRRLIFFPLFYNPRVL